MLTFAFSQLDPRERAAYCKETYKTNYCAHVRIDGNQKCLGTRKTPEAAHELYMAASRQLHGEFGRTA
jgi:hypothetical protein